MEGLGHRPLVMTGKVDATSVSFNFAVSVLLVPTPRPNLHPVRQLILA